MKNQVSSVLLDLSQRGVPEDNKKPVIPTSQQNGHTSQNKKTKRKKKKVLENKPLSEVLTELHQEEKVRWRLCCNFQDQKMFFKYFELKRIPKNQPSLSHPTLRVFRYI